MDEENKRKENQLLPLKKGKFYLWFIWDGGGGDDDSVFMMMMIVIIIFLVYLWWGENVKPKTHKIIISTWSNVIQKFLHYAMQRAKWNMNIKNRNHHMNKADF